MVAAAIATLVAACGGGGGSGGSGGGGAASTAPTIAFAASTVSVEGGETIVFDATAKSAAGESLAVSLTCNGGDLRGFVLLTQEVSASQTIRCTASARDAGGRSAEKSIDIAVNATVVSVKLGSSSGVPDIGRGQAALFFVSGLDLAPDTYALTVGQSSVTGYRISNGAVGFIVPSEVPLGEQLISIQIGDRKYSIAVNISEPALPADVRGFVRSEMQAAEARISEILTTSGATMTAGQRAIFEENRQALAQGLAAIDTFTAEELREAALSLLQAPLSASVTGIQFQYPSSAASERCDRALADYRARLTSGGIKLAWQMAKESNKSVLSRALNGAWNVSKFLYTTIDKLITDIGECITLFEQQLEEDFCRTSGVQRARGL